MSENLRLKVVHLSTYAGGGAGKATVRLHDGLRRLGVDSQLLVLEEGEHGEGVETVRSLPFLEQLGDRLRTLDYRIATRVRRRNDRFFTSDRGSRTASFARQLAEADVLHLHWISFLIDQPSFLGALPRDLPIVWTTHDLNPVTGGCHVPYGCERFKSHCGRCPQLRVPRDSDLSYQIFERKVRARAGKWITYVSPSQWATDQVAASVIARGAAHLKIPLGMDTDAFSPRPKAQSRASLALPAEGVLIGFIAQYLDDTNKDLATLAQAMIREPGWELVTVGERPPSLPPELKVRHLGRLAGAEDLARFYSAVDIVAVTSRFESFGQAASEASACGTPVVASDTSGLRDVVVEGETGWFFEPGNVDSLAKALEAAMATPLARRAQMGEAARRRAVTEFGLEAYAGRYLELYRSLVRAEGG